MFSIASKPVLVYAIVYVVQRNHPTENDVKVEIFYLPDNIIVGDIIFIILAFRESKKIEDQFWLGSTMAA